MSMSVATTTTTTATTTTTTTLAPPPLTTTAAAFTPIFSNNNGNNNNRGSGRGNNSDGANASYGSFEAGGFIYVILVGAMLVALVYFGRVILSKRQERLRRLKGPDFEANPPTYMSHVQDLQVVEASELHLQQQGQQDLLQQQQFRPRSTSSSNISVINAPAAALIRGNGHSADGDLVNYYLVTPRVMHEHQRQQQRHTRSSSSPSAASIFAQAQRQGSGERRNRTRTETHSSPPHPRGSSGLTPIVPMFLAIPPSPSEPQPPAYEDLSPRQEQMNTSSAPTATTTVTTSTSTSTSTGMGTHLSVSPPRIDSLPGANTTSTSTSSATTPV
ncbi:MAG: hypothetical protein J3R72DRAFT_432642 [Linnemannia gamsii]|nr:MAG: hypothetical protein J3R72DRAFT_432642 [Linnemannia gamsii]